MKINQWIKSIQFCLVPPVCMLCGQAGDGRMDLCGACRHDLPMLESCCVRCAEPLPAGVWQALCGRCLSRPPAFERTLALFAYQSPVDVLLQRLKFQGRLEVAHLLGELMARWLAEIITDPPDMLVPVPLHGQRLCERGFNQSLELGRYIARQLQLPLEATACRRLRATESQSGLNRRQRLRNVKGAFVVEGELSGHVAIIDDVMTTGSTVHELARVLLKAGAERVDVWVCARA